MTKDINLIIPQAMEAENAILVDVRNKDEFSLGHIPGAVNIPLSDIPYCISQLKDLDRPVVCYCLSEARSRQARANLKKMGFTNVTNAGGIGAWTGPLEK